MKTPDLSGKNILLTGASSGIGRGTALALAAAGASLILVARDRDSISRLAVECTRGGARALPVPTDVSDPAQMQDLFQTALTEFGHLDIWINDAGVGSIGPFDQIPLQDHLQTIHTDLIGTLIGSYHALRHFRFRRCGILINIASVVGKIPAPYYSSYTAAKYGIVGLNASLRQEIQLDDLRDIHICTVMPMAMDTPFFDTTANHTGHQATPIPPLYDPSRVVDTILDLISHPRPEVVVGTMGKIMVAAHQIMPSAVEKTMAHQTHNAQYRDAPPAPPTSGALHHPVDQETIRSASLTKK